MSVKLPAELTRGILQPFQLNSGITSLNALSKTLPIQAVKSNFTIQNVSYIFFS